MNEKDELKPCPFCGSKNVFLTEPLNEDEYGVMCDSCGAVGALDEDGEVAISLWNKRVSDEIEERLKVAEGFLMSAANYGMGIQQARKYFGQDNPNYINPEDPPGYDELEVYKGKKK